MDELHQSVKTPLPPSVEEVMKVAVFISKLRHVAVPNQEVPKS